MMLLRHHSRKRTSLSHLLLCSPHPARNASASAKSATAITASWRAPPRASDQHRPAARKASIEASLEMGVPAYALPGEQVWAMGLHAGARKRFKAEVVGLRSQFPRIVVMYISTEDGNTNAIALQELPTAYLCAADIQPKDW